MTPEEIQELQKCSQVLAAALTAENVSFMTYAIMAAIREAPESPSLARVSLDLGASYHAVSKAVERTNFMEKRPGNPLVVLSLSAEGSAKMERIQKRLARHELHPV